MDATIDELENLAPTVHKFTVKAEAEKPAEKAAEQMNARVGEKSPALVTHCTFDYKNNSS